MTSFQWLPLYDIAVYCGLGFGLLCLSLLARRLGGSLAGRNWGLLLLRLPVLAVLVCLLANPVMVTDTQLPPRAPDLVYLIDSSKSMTLGRPTRRLDRVERVFEQTSGFISANRKPCISRYRFGRKLVAIPSSEKLCADEDATRLIEALRQLPRRFGEGWPSALVVFSDGRTTESGSFEEVASGYRQQGVPIHVFPVGNPKVIGDVAIEDLAAPRDAPAGTKIPVRIQIRSHGYNNQRAEIHIRAKTDFPSKPLATLPVMLSDGSQTHELIIGQIPTTGKLIAKVPLLAGEAIAENNRIAFQIAARNEKLRVIYMEGTTGCYQRVPEALKEDNNIDCITMELNNQRIQRPKIQRVTDRQHGYPATREELFSYDVIICSDIPRVSFTKEQLKWTVDLVAERGGGFAMIGGHTAFGSGGWDQTVWDGLIPVDVSTHYGKGYVYHRFQVQVPHGVDRHPIWRIVDDPIRNREILDQMPRFTGTNLVKRLKPAATVLGTSDRTISTISTMPVFSCQSFKKGRTFAMTTDTTVDWGIYFEKNWGEGDNRYFRKFWRNVVYWLGENSIRRKRRLHVKTDKLIYRSGQQIQITARAYDKKSEQTDRYRLLARLCKTVNSKLPEENFQANSIQQSTLSAHDNDQIYRGNLSAPPLRSISNAVSSLGELSLEAVAYNRGKVEAQTSVKVQIIENSVEFHNPQPDAVCLEELARNTGGTVLHTAEELAQLINETEDTPGETIINRAPAWDNPLLWGLLILLLSAEWIIRRLLGLG